MIKPAKKPEKTRLLDLISEDDIEKAEIEVLKSAINQMVARRHIEKRDVFAELISMTPNELNKRLTFNTKLKYREKLRILKTIKSHDVELYLWAIRTLVGDENIFYRETDKEIIGIEKWT